MDRKAFLRISCNSCLIGAAALLVPGCSPSAYNVFKTEAVNNTIQVPLQLFKNSSLQIVRPKGWQYDIAVQKKPDNTFTALMLRCTHMDNQLITAQNGFSCSLHGSRFNAEGAVIKGPAESNLKKFNTRVENNNIVILI
jgi:Rieske Fe-S protein